MSHFAEIKNGIVTNCVYVPNVSDVEEEIVAAEQSFIDALVGTWVQTSCNTHGGKHSLGGTPLRKNYAVIGGVYDSTRDAFYLPQPYASWTFDETTCFWVSPVEYPDDNNMYGWSEDAYQEDNSKGWISISKGWENGIILNG
jgi:hypothetical protein